jgi:hypothetical protein
MYFKISYLLQSLGIRQMEERRKIYPIFPPNQSRVDLKTWRLVPDQPRLHSPNKHACSLLSFIHSYHQWRPGAALRTGSDASATAKRNGDRLSREQRQQDDASSREAIGGAERSIECLVILNARRPKDQRRLRPVRHETKDQLKQAETRKGRDG